MKKAIIFLLALSCLLFFAACNDDSVEQLFDNNVGGFTGAISSAEDFEAWTDFGGPAYLTKDLTVYGSYDLEPVEGGSDFNLNLKGHTLTFGDPADLSKGLEPLKKAKKASTAKVTVVSTVKLEIKSTNDTGAAVTAQIKVEKDTSDDADKKQGTLIQNEGGKVEIDGVDVENNGGETPLFVSTEKGTLDIKDSKLTSSPTDNSTPSDLIMTDSGTVNLNNVDTDNKNDEPVIKVVNSVESMLTSGTDADKSAYDEKPVVNLVDSFKDTTPSDLIEGSDKAEVNVSVTTLTITPTSLTIKEGETATLTATVSPTDDYTLIWTTSGNGVVSVSDKGVVTALKRGTETVRVTVDGKNVYAECEVTVAPKVAKPALLKNGYDFNSEAKKVIDGITTIKFVTNQEKPATTPTNIVSDTASEELAWLEKDGTTLLVKTSGQQFKTPSSAAEMFYQLSNVQEIDFNNALDTSSSTDFSTFFSSCGALTTVDLSMIDTSNATSISSMFSGCTTLTDIDLSGFDTSNVTNMSNLFYGCNSLSNITFGENFDTGKVTNMQNMFYECKALTNTDFVKDFDVTNVTKFGSMFKTCVGIVSVDLSSWDISNATDIGTMFYECSNLSSVKMPTMTSSTNLTSMRYLFAYCNNLSDISFPDNFDTSKVTTMEQTFRNCLITNTDFLSHFDTSSVTNMSYMFYNCDALISANLSNFNTSNVTTMQNMFANEDYLETLDISSFNTTSTTNFNYMFDDGLYRVKSIKTGDNFVINVSTDSLFSNGFARYTSDVAQIICTNKSTADKLVNYLGSSTWGYTEASAPYTVKKKTT